MSYSLLAKAESPQSYASLAQKGIMVAHPVSFSGKTHRDDIGVKYHATVKASDQDLTTPTEMHRAALQANFQPIDPKTTGIEPSTFKDRFGKDVHIIKLRTGNDSLKQANSHFEHIKQFKNHEFVPHISVDAETWHKIKNSGAKTAHEAGIEFGPAKLYHGQKELATYQPKKTKIEPMAASESSSLQPISKAEMAKSDYGPRGADLYSPVDNARRKMDRTSEIVEAAGPNKAVKATTPSFKDQAHKEAREARMKSKANPVKVYSQKEKLAFARKTKQKVVPIAKTEEPLEKGLISHIGTAAMMAGALGVAAPSVDAAKPSQAQSQAHHYDHQSMLNAISQVESSGGKFVNHRELHGHVNEGEKALGAYALTPATIRETIKMHPELKAQHGKAVNLRGEEMGRYMQDNPGLDQTIASKHLDRLEHHFGHDPSTLGFSWLQGITATHKAINTGENIHDHWHAKKVREAYKQPETRYSSN